MAKKRKLNKKALAIVAFILVIFELLVFFSGYMTGVHKTQKDYKSISVESAAPSEESKEDLKPTKKQKEKKDSETKAPKDEKEEEKASDDKKAGSAESAKAVDAVMEKMTVSDMIYQMMFVTPESITNMGVCVAAGETTKSALSQYPVGGIIYFSQNFESRKQTIDMIKNTQSYSEIPLFIGVDEEGGRVSRLGNNPEMEITQHPAMRKVGDSGDLKKAYQIGETLAKELSEFGFNVDFAPDADVLINQNNTEIGDRSFGTDPNIVADMVKNVTNGLEENGMSATLKHFPGHGSTYVDSHTGYSESKRTLDEMRNAEFLPFKAAVNADFVMVSHMTPVNAIKEKVPASISKEIITDVLKGELGYSGIVITDSFSMGAICEEYSVADASVRAVNAGVDMILMPSNLTETHNAILNAVKSGKISQSRIEESVRKILTLKFEKGMLK